MPNWCQNRLQVSSEDEETIQQFREDVKGEKTELSLNSLVPMPQELEMSDGWYTWRVDHWGTKWDVYAHLNDEDEYFLEYAFNSAWTPPSKWLHHVTELYPKLRFILIYEDLEAGFMGVCIGDDGEIIQEEGIHFA